MSVDASKFAVIATDTTLLQSAWSAVAPKGDYGGVPENRAADAFVESTQRYVYYRQLFVPVPGGEKGTTNPLMDLWFDANDGTQECDESPLVTDASDVDIAWNQDIALLKAFLKDIQSDTESYRAWVQFQFSETITDEYTSRVSVSGRDPLDPVIEARDLIAPSLSWPELEDVRRQMCTVTMSRWHFANCKSQFGSDVAQYSLCYAYSLFRRGRQYGIRMRGKSYTPHWSRIPAQCLPDIDKAVSASHQFNGYANWGAIVYALIADGFVSKDANKIRDLLRSIRESVQSGQYDLRTTAVKDRVRILEKAGTYAKFSADPPFYAKLSGLPEDFLKSIPQIGPSLAPVLRVVTFLGNNPLVEQFDARLTRVALWDAYQKAFYIPRVFGRPPNKTG